MQSFFVVENIVIYFQSFSAKIVRYLSKNKQTNKTKKADFTRFWQSEKKKWGGGTCI